MNPTILREFRSRISSFTWIDREAVSNIFFSGLGDKFLDYVDKYIKQERINVTGTNGKTTTSGILSHLILEDNKSLVNNAKGANNLTIDGCVFVGKFDNGGVAVAFTDQGRSSGQSGNITIKNCKFEVEGANAYIYMHYSGKGFFNIEDNLFASNTFSNPIYLGRYQSSTPVVLKNNVFEKVSTLEDAIYVQAHSETYNVSVDASNNTFAE
jgi:hypothetical protein